jgi:hypothetical protein
MRKLSIDALKTGNNLRTQLPDIRTRLGKIRTHFPDESGKLCNCRGHVLHLLVELLT